MNYKVKTNRLQSLYILLLFVSLTSYTVAQTGSPYSRYGLGNFQQKGSVRTRTMGGAGIAMQSKGDVNNLNPSALALMDSMSVLLDLGFHVNQSRFSYDGDHEDIYSGNIDYVTLTVPFQKWWFFSASMQPITNVDYNIVTTETYSGSSEAEYTVNYDGSGGVNLASISNCFKLPWGFSIGAETGFLWGNHDETIKEYYTNMDVSTSTRNTTSYLKGFWLTTGAQYKHTFDKLSLSLGAIYTIPTIIKAEKETTIYTSYSTIEDKTGKTSSYNMPEGYGAGLCVYYDKKITISADYRINKWSETEFGVDPQRLCDNSIYSIGGEYIPDYNSNSYLNRVCYRAGFHYESGSFKVYGIPVESAHVSVGVGLPGRMRSTINVGFDFGTIGGFNNKHITETYGQINIGINLGEIWFVKPKFD